MKIMSLQCRKIWMPFKIKVQRKFTAEESEHEFNNVCMDTLQVLTWLNPLSTVW